MFISAEKKENNIAEYIIYMWQIESIIRALHFNLENIKHTIVAQANCTDEQKDQLTAWYEKLLSQMKDQRIEEKGHLIEIREVLDELELLHDMLLNMIKDEKYTALFNTAQPYIMELKQKTDKPNSDIQTCFTGLFGVMQMKMQKHDVSNETAEAINTFSAMIALLAQKYHEMKAGKLEFPKTMQN
jgi:hypothetical protein